MKNYDNDDMKSDKLKCWAEYHVFVVINNIGLNCRGGIVHLQINKTQLNNVEQGNVSH